MQHFELKLPQETQIQAKLCKNSMKIHGAMQTSGSKKIHMLFIVGNYGKYIKSHAKNVKQNLQRSMSSSE